MGKQPPEPVPPRSRASPRHREGEAKRLTAELLDGQAEVPAPEEDLGLQLPIMPQLRPARRVLVSAGVKPGVASSLALATQLARRLDLAPFPIVVDGEVL